MKCKCGEQMVIATTELLGKETAVCYEGCCEGVKWETVNSIWVNGEGWRKPINEEIGIQNEKCCKYAEFIGEPYAIASDKCGYGVCYQCKFK